MRITLRQRGLTLIELIVFIVIVSVALVGVLSVFNVTVRSSADPMIRKQMLAIAEALLEEVQLQPFTWCDPDDPQAATATSNTPAIPTGCTLATTVEAIGVETVSGNTDDRLSNTSPFDNVSDYHSLTPIDRSASGTVMPPDYSAIIEVSNDASFGVTASLLPSTEVLRIRVTVTHGSEEIVLEGYRTRHSPNMLP